MAKTANITIRISPDVKSKVENLYSNFGITISDAINMFLHQSLLEGGLPFDLKQPRYNKETEEAIKEARAISKGLIDAKLYSSAKAMLNDIEED